MERGATAANGGAMKRPTAARIACATALAWLSMQAPAAATRIVLTPDTGHPGATIEVKGKHFAPNEAVDVYFDNTDELLVATNGRGGFRNHNLPLPADALPGDHWVTAIGRRSGLAAQASVAVGTDWSMYNFGPERNGYNPYENVLAPDNVSGLSLSWSEPIGEDSFVNSSPAVVGGVLYVGVHDGSTNNALLAFDASSGAPLWAAQAATGFGTQSSPAVANGAVYIGAQEQIYAYDAATGAQLWVVNTTGEVYSSPTIVNSVVYVGATDGSLYALNASTGAQIWAANTGSPLYCSPAVVNGVVYVGGSGYPMMVSAYNASTGALLWNANTGDDGSVRGAPSVAGGIVYFGSTDYSDADLLAYEAATGSLVWSARLGRVIDSTPAVANGVAYVETDGQYTHTDNDVIAMNAATGAVIWSAKVPTANGGGVIMSAPAVANGVVYVGSGNGVMYAFDAASGAQLWNSGTLGEFIFASPVVSNGMVYVETGSNIYAGTLNAFALNSGHHRVYRNHQAAPDVHTLQPDWRLEMSF